jgi:hypothetical protein
LEQLTDRDACCVENKYQELLGPGYSSFEDDPANAVVLHPTRYAVMENTSARFNA